MTVTTALPAFAADSAFAADLVDIENQIFGSRVEEDHVAAKPSRDGRISVEQNDLLETIDLHDLVGVNGRDIVARKSTASLCGAEHDLLETAKINSYNFTYGFVCSVMGLFVLPMEASRLYPDEESLMLGLMLLVVGVTQLICPVAGMLSDLCVHPLGRRRPFIVGGTATCAVASLGMWFTSVYYEGIMFFLMLFIAMLAINVMYSATCGFVPDFVAPEMQGKVSGLVAVLQLSGAVVAFLFMYITRSYSVHVVYPFFLLLSTATCVLQFKSAEEVAQKDSGSYPVVWGFPIVPMNELKKCYVLDLKGDLDFFWVFVGRTLYYMAVSCQAFLLYYVRDMLDVPSETEGKEIMAFIALFGQLTGGAVAYPMGRLSDSPKVGRKKLVCLACLTMSMVYTGFLCVGYFGESKLMAVYALAMLYGVGNGSFLSVDTALALDVIPDKTEAAQALGIWGVSAFIGSAVGPMFWGVALWAFAKPEAPETFSYGGYVLMLGGGMVCVLLAGFVIRKVKKTT